MQQCKFYESPQRNPGKVENLSPHATLNIKDGSKIVVLRLDDVIYIESNGDYLGVFTNDKKILA
jgi:DNA-binding LytR/AlgR family response regulator